MYRFFIVTMLFLSAGWADINDLIDHYSIQYIRLNSDPYLSDYDLGRKDAYYEILNNLWIEYSLMHNSQQSKLSQNTNSDTTGLITECQGS